MNIIVFGASQVYGANDWKHGGWVGLLKSYVEKESEFENAVYNLGICGDKSSDILNRFEPELVPRLEENGKNVVIISAGINDSRYSGDDENKTETNPENYRKNIEKMIKLAKKHADVVLFAGFIPIDDSKLKPVPWIPEASYSENNVIKFNKIAKDVCSKADIQFLDLTEILTKSNYKKLLDDGLHPNEKGGEVVYNLVLDFLKENNVL